MTHSRPVSSGEAERLRGEHANIAGMWQEVSETLRAARANVTSDVDDVTLSALWAKAGSWKEHVAELFSPPRVVLEAVKQGLCGELSMDILTGWELGNTAGQRRAWDGLRRGKSMLVVICVPCTMLTIIQNMNQKFV